MADKNSKKLRREITDVGLVGRVVLFNAGKWDEVTGERGQREERRGEKGKGGEGKKRKRRKWRGEERRGREG